MKSGTADVWHSAGTNSCFLLTGFAAVLLAFSVSGRSRKLFRAVYSIKMQRLLHPQTDFTAFCSFTVRSDLIPGGSQQADTSQPPHRFCQNFSNNSDTSRYIHYITDVKFCLVKVRRPRCKFWGRFPWNHDFAHYLRCVFCAFCYHKLRVYNILGPKIQHQLAYCSFGYHWIIFRDSDRTFFVIWSYCGIVSHGILAANIDNMNVRFFFGRIRNFGNARCLPEVSHGGSCAFWRETNAKKMC